MADPDPPDPRDDDSLDPTAFRPPDIPTQVYCLHCGEVYESYLIQWVEEEHNGRRMGFWRCPTPGCSGAGYGFDILPTDNSAPGWNVDDDEEDEESDEFGEFDDLCGDCNDEDDDCGGGCDHCPGCGGSPYPKDFEDEENPGEDERPERN